MDLMLGRNDWSGDTVKVEVLRGLSIYWTGTVKIWNNENGVHGRRNTGEAEKDWEVGDKLRLQTCKY